MNGFERFLKVFDGCEWVLMVFNDFGWVLMGFFNGFGWFSVQTSPKAIPGQGEQLHLEFLGHWGGEGAQEPPDRAWGLPPRGQGSAN